MTKQTKTILVVAALAVGGYIAYQKYSAAKAAGPTIAP